MSTNLSVSRARKAAPSPKPPDAKGAVDDARKSVEDAATVSGTLWLSYLFTLFYIGLAAGGVTHKDLLLENPVRLPFLGVDLPLIGFFLLAPILFVIVHAYTLMHFVMLAGKIGAFDAAMQDFDGAADEIRRRLPSNIFAQFLAGPDDIRKGALGVLLKALAWVSLVFAPVVLLLFLQAQFLPYHLESITWVQRFTVLADVALLWALWPAVLEQRSALRWPPLRAAPFTTALALIASAAPLVLAFFIATYPGEWLDEAIRQTQWLRNNAATGLLRNFVKDKKGEDIEDAASLRHFLFVGDVDYITRRPKSLFSTSLVLIGVDALDAAKIDSDDKLKWAKRPLSARGRDLRGARLDFADLRKADLDGANLQDAALGAAQLQGASLNTARLRGASLDNAQLQGASLIQAELQGASLAGAQMQGSSLDVAQLQGASLDFAQLQGSSLGVAQLQGASLVEAQLQGTWLYLTQLQGASLDRAQLQSASLIGAQLQGASLDRAQLQGTLLVNVQLQGAWINQALVWRSDMRGMTYADKSRIVAPNIGKSVGCLDWEVNGCVKYELGIEALLRSLDSVPNGAQKTRAIEQLKRLEPDALPNDSEITDEWLRLAKISISSAALVAEQCEIACRQNDPYASAANFSYAGAPYVARALARRLNANSLSSENAAKTAFAEALLKPGCAGAQGLTDAEKAELRALVPKPPAAQLAAPTAKSP